MKRGRRPQDPNDVPFEDLLPLEIRNHVSGKSRNAAELACIPEMQSMLTCLKNHEFDQSRCLTETTKFKSCFETFMKVQHQKELVERSGILAPGAKTISAKLLNKFLKKFPLPK